jgi:hypothetical protein
LSFTSEVLQVLQLENLLSAVRCGRLEKRLLLARTILFCEEFARHSRFHLEFLFGARAPL